MVRILVILLTLSSCSYSQRVSNTKTYMKCRLELYCTKTEGSLIKGAALKAIETYFGTTTNNGLCEKHYQAWGFDYRKPVLDRCGD